MMGLICGPGGDRTHNLRINSPPLLPLELLGRIVEDNGLEPFAFWLQTKRSNQMS